MKKNNRGFLLAESLVVSTFVLTVLILLYIQFNNLTNNYKNSYNYNNVESIYDLSSVSNYLLNNNYNLSNQLTASKPYVIVYKNGSCNMDAGIIDSFCDNLINRMDAKTVIYTSSDISVIQKYVSTHDDSNINQKLREFISRVETSTIQNKGRLFAEFNNGTYATIAMDTETIISGEEPITPPAGGDTTTNVGGQTVPVTNTGDGLYNDTSESGKHTYKGQEPNNYITFAGEKAGWRILSIGSDGTIKIIRSSSIGTQMWDTNDANSGRNNSNNTYCKIASGTYYGCNAWSNVQGNFVNGTITGTVTQNSSLNTYLNGTYLNSLSDSGKITAHNWSVGPVTSDNNNLQTQINSENSITWNGKVGLITISEYLRANTNATECGTFSLNNKNYEKCAATNWLVQDRDTLWTISPMFDDTNVVFNIFTDGYISNNYVRTKVGVTPVVYLSSGTTLRGSGTKSDPYVIQ